MTGEQKLYAILFICCAFAISAVAVSISYYCTSVDCAAVKAGLVQERTFGKIIWVKPK